MLLTGEIGHIDDIRFVQSTLRRRSIAAPGIAQLLATCRWHNHNWRDLDLMFLCDDRSRMLARLGFWLETGRWL
jgi:hypothetical protein